MRAAFYKGTRPGIPGLYNRLGRYLDGRGRYSHTELIFASRMSASSSFEDGGVRIKKIGYSSVDSWDFLSLPEHWEAEAHKWYSRHCGQPYDWVAQLKFGIGFLQVEDPSAWYCNESLLAALAVHIGSPRPHRHGPNGSYEILIAAGAVPVAGPW